MISFDRDTHIHTKYSPDADQNATFESYIEKAKKVGLKEIVFTDHVDFDAAHPLFETMIDYDSYVEEFSKLEKDKDIEFKLGVEIGYQPHVKDQIKSFIQRYPFEHVILSIHYIDRLDLYTREYFLGKTKKEAYQRYFESLLDAVQEMDQYSVVGHFDYITRYSQMGDYEFEDYKGIIDKILQEIIRKGKGIEINTSGFSHEGRFYPKMEIVNRFIELGGKNITIGSDSHRVDELKREFKQVETVLKNRTN